MRNIAFFKILLLLSVFYLPLVTKLLIKPIPSAVTPKKEKFGISHCQVIKKESNFVSYGIKKIKETWFVTTRVVNEVNNADSKSIGFAKTLFNIYRDFKLDLIGISPWPEKVILGTNGWLFVGNSFSNGIKEYLGIDTISLRQLSFMRNNFKDFETWRRKAGFAFYLAIAPDKPYIYGNYLPFSKYSNNTEIDQVKKNLSEIGIKVIDLQQDFPAVKKIRLYHKTDTHWNSYGAYLGYITLITTIRKDFPAVTVRSADEYILDSVDWDQGELSRMIAIKNSEKRITMKAKYKVNETREPDQFNVPDYHVGSIDDYEIRINNPEKKLSILIFRDSFFTDMSYFFSNDFQKEVFIWDHLSRSKISQIKPDIVIYEIVGRNIDVLATLNYK